MSEEFTDVDFGQVAERFSVDELYEILGDIVRDKKTNPATRASIAIQVLKAQQRLAGAATSAEQIKEMEFHELVETIRTMLGDNRIQRMLSIRVEFI